MAVSSDASCVFPITARAPRDSAQPKIFASGGGRQVAYTKQTSKATLKSQLEPD